MKKLLLVQAMLAVLICTSPAGAAGNGGVSKHLPQVPKMLQGTWKRYDVDGWITTITATTIGEPGYADCDIKKIKQIKDPNDGLNGSLVVYQIDEQCYGEEDHGSSVKSTSGLVKSLWALRKISSGDYVLVITYPNFNSIEVFQREN